MESLQYEISFNWPFLLANNKKGSMQFMVLTELGHWQQLAIDLKHKFAYSDQRNWSHAIEKSVKAHIIFDMHIMV